MVDRIPLLEVKDLTVFYENALAVNEVDLSVHEGELVGVFGSNSAGKTTLLNTVAGLTHHLKHREQVKGGLRITIEGTVRFAGEDITDWKPTARVQKGLFLCRERHPVFKDNTVDENLRLGGYLRSKQQIKDGIDYAYQVFPPLTRLRRRKAGMLSGGEQEMVAIGMALVSHPDLLLMDEPLLGLSPAMQDQVVQAVEQISADGLTVLITEQYARPIMPIIDRGYVIENGTVLVEGTSDELLDNPEVRAAYFGT